jgi:hypothetical protein
VASKYEEAFVALYKAPFESFVAERKRLAAELTSSGDATGAARLAKVTRPPVSAWAVNQLYWRDRRSFDALFKTAEVLRDPDPSADDTKAHRDVIAKLRAGAGKILGQAGKSANEATLWRVGTTLTALAAIGGFDPDPPGALKGDRDPPGFDVAGLVPGKPGKRKPEAPTTKRESAADERKKKAEAKAEERRLEREEKQRDADRERVERKLRIAQGVFEARKEEISRLKEQLAEAEEGLDGARGVVREIEKELKKL